MIAEVENLYLFLKMKGLVKGDEDNGRKNY